MNRQQDRSGRHTGRRYSRTPKGQRRHSGQRDASVGTAHTSAAYEEFLEWKAYKSFAARREAEDQASKRGRSRQKSPKGGDRNARSPRRRQQTADAPKEIGLSDFAKLATAEQVRLLKAGTQLTDGVAGELPAVPKLPFALPKASSTDGASMPTQSGTENEYDDWDEESALNMTNSRLSDTITESEEKSDERSSKSDATSTDDEKKQFRRALALISSRITADKSSPEALHLVKGMYTRK